MAGTVTTAGGHCSEGFILLKVQKEGVLEAPDTGKKKTVFESADGLTPWAQSAFFFFFFSGILKAQPHCWIPPQAVSNSQALGEPVFYGERLLK